LIKNIVKDGRFMLFRLTNGSLARNTGERVKNDRKEWNEIFTTVYLHTKDLSSKVL